jgi:hypothetical protein
MHVAVGAFTAFRLLPRQEGAAFASHPDPLPLYTSVQLTASPMLLEESVERREPLRHSSASVTREMRPYLVCVTLGPPPATPSAFPMPRGRTRALRRGGTLLAVSAAGFLAQAFVILASPVRSLLRQSDLAA